MSNEQLIQSLVQRLNLQLDIPTVHRCVPPCLPGHQVGYSASPLFNQAAIRDACDSGRLVSSMWPFVS